MLSINSDRWPGKVYSRIFTPVSRLSRWLTVILKKRVAERRSLIPLLALIMTAAFISGLPAALDVWGVGGENTAAVTVIAVPGIITAEPTVTSYLPANAATSVIPDDNLVLTFNGTVVEGTGNIVIYKPDNTPFETIAVTDDRVSISGSEVTINLNGVLASGTIYYVQIAATALDNTGGSSYDGITDTTTWYFTTVAYSDRVDDSLVGAQTDYTVTNVPADTIVTTTTTDSLIITILKYEDNPHPAVSLPPKILTDSFIDVSINLPDGVVWPLYVEQGYTDAEIVGVQESSLRMYYFDPTNNTWRQCSDTGVDLDANFVWARITEAEFYGNQLIIAGASIGDGGGILPIRYLNVNILGTRAQFRISYIGQVLEEISVASLDGKITVMLPKGITVLNEYGNPLGSIVIAPAENAPLPPDGMVIIGKTYEFSPSGVTYTPDASVRWAYDQADIPEDVPEESLAVAYYHYHQNPEDNDWHKYDSSVDIENNVVTAGYPSHSIHALLGTITPAPAAFSVSYPRIEPREVQPGELVTIIVSVVNTGGTEGSYSLFLRVDGVTEAMKRVTIAAGESQTVQFSVVREDVGSYSIAVDERNNSFTVVAAVPAEEEEQPPVSTPPSSGEEEEEEEEEVIPPSSGEEEEEEEVPEAPTEPFNLPLITGLIATVTAIALVVIFRRRVSQALGIFFPRISGD